MDSSIGRLQAALASATNEVTVAAANLNFDFSIVKYEAPKEYHSVGQLLSARRKQEAEDGRCHSTARRLAALFAGVCPNTPELIKAYGQRASEIAEEATSKVSKEHFASIFSQYTGIDATSMWAAATSSKAADGGAIQIHLLACLLASTWDAPEAISIWVQIIDERRRDIAARVERGEEVEFAKAAAAAQQEIPRHQLAEWDASARSWLETANTVKGKQQTQLRVILKNVEFSVSPKPTVYTNVVAVWRTAMTTLDSLVSGIAQEVNDGSIVIGLLAWNLYPDMQVFGYNHVEVKMNDALIRDGGILTLGCSPSATTPKSGITWSLSLAHLKFYGDPVETTARLEGDSSRLTLGEFRLVLLGSLLRLWEIPSAEDPAAIKIMALLSLQILKMAKTYEQLIGIFELLGQAATDYENDPASSAIFINLGRNRPRFCPRRDAENIIGDAWSRPFFGLLETSAFLNCLKGPRDKVRALQHFATHNAELINLGAIIRLKTAVGGVRFIPLRTNIEDAGLSPKATSVPGQSIRLFDPNSKLPQLALEPFDLPGVFKDKGNNSDRSSSLESHAQTLLELLRFSGNDPTGIEQNSEHFFTLGSLRYCYCFGDSTSAAIFVPLGSHHPGRLWFGPGDLCQALQLGAFECGKWIQSGLTAHYEFPWLSLYGYALRCLRGLSGPLISVRMLNGTLYDPKWMIERSQAHRDFRIGWDQQNFTTQEILSVLVYFLEGCDMGPSDIQDNTVGVSYGNSIYVPTKVSPLHLVLFCGLIPRVPTEC